MVVGYRYSFLRCSHVDQLMKQVAKAKRNGLFLGSPDAGDRAVTPLTLISTFLQHDLDVCAYLNAAIDQLQAGSTDDHSLRPDVWKLAHPEVVRAYRTEERRDAATRTRQTRAQRRLTTAKMQNARYLSNRASAGTGLHSHGRPGALKTICPCWTTKEKQQAIFAMLYNPEPNRNAWAYKEMLSDLLGHTTAALVATHFKKLVQASDSQEA
jgi:hypothetical protein